jgi:hypothetical protein
MRKGDSAARAVPDPRCGYESHRTVRLRLPHVEAEMVRMVLATETGLRFEVSRLYRLEGGWALTICRECAKRGLLAAVVFIAILAAP